MIISTPVSLGELVDKISILKIKLARITDPNKLANVNIEHQILNTIFEETRANIQTSIQPALFGLSVKLKTVNEHIWDIEDNIRDHEHRGDFGDSFVQLARGVYHNNDERAALKREINNLIGSRLTEEKSYKEYKNEKASGNG